MSLFDLVISHVLLLARGCQHPTWESEVVHMDVDGERIPVFIDTCIMCKQWVVSACE